MAYYIVRNVTSEADGRLNDVLAGSLGLVGTMIEHTLRLDSTGFLTNSHKD